MMINAASWQRASELFDQFATLTPELRELKLQQLRLDQATSTWLQKLLQAHDSSDTHLLDQTLNQMAADLIGAKHVPGGEIPEQLDGQLLGHWRVSKPIARGAMAVVMHGERADGAYEQHVAIKLLQPGPYRHSESEQLSEELRLLARLEHPGIARLLDGGISAQGWPYLVMEYVDGMHINQWCQQQQLDWRARLRLMLKVCDAVRYAHSKLVVHADIKPSNVLVNQDGEPKLVDFGIASLLRTNPEAEQPGAGLVLRCSPAYAAPEQLRGEPVTTANDVFGLGALLYELLTGQRIRDGETVTTLLLGRDQANTIIPPSQRSQTLKQARQLRGDLDAICLHAMAQDPQQRYRSAAELCLDLEHALQHYPVSARASTKKYLLSRWLYRHRLATSSVFSIFLSLIIGLGFSIRQTGIANRNAHEAEVVTEFLISVFDVAEPGNFESAQVVPRRDLAERAAEHLDLIIEQHPEARIDLLIAIGSILRQTGLGDRARPVLQQAVDELQHIDSKGTDPRQVTAWYELGQIESLAEHLVPAAEAFRQADALAKNLKRPSVGRSAILFQLGRVLSASHQTGAALAILDEAASLANETDGTSTLLPRIRLLTALTLNRAGQTEASLQAGEQAVQDARLIFGDEHNRTASALSTVGAMLRRTGRLERAETMLQEAYSIGQRAYGQPDSATTNNLAMLKFTLGNFTEAETLQTQALALAETHYGREAAATARYRRDLAMIQMWRGHWSDALTNMQEAVSNHIADTSADHHYSVFMRAQLAWVQLQSGQMDAVAELLPELLQKAPDLVASYPRGALWIHMLAAKFNLLNNNPDLAMEQIKIVDEVFSAYNGNISLNNHEKVELSLIAGDAYADNNNLYMAREKWLDALNFAEQLLGKDHALRREVTSHLSSTQLTAQTPKK